jgi:hypothetical protein
LQNVIQILSRVSGRNIRASSLTFVKKCQVSRVFGKKDESRRIAIDHVGKVRDSRDRTCSNFTFVTS